MEVPWKPGQHPNPRFGRKNAGGPPRKRIRKPPVGASLFFLVFRVLPLGRFVQMFTERLFQKPPQVARGLVCAGRRSGSEPEQASELAIGRSARPATHRAEVGPETGPCRVRLGQPDPQDPLDLPAPALGKPRKLRVRVAQGRVRAGPEPHPSLFDVEKHRRLHDHGSQSIFSHS
jgi:hypothetical protein